MGVDVVTDMLELHSCGAKVGWLRAAGPLEAQNWLAQRRSQESQAAATTAEGEESLAAADLQGDATAATEEAQLAAREASEVVSEQGSHATSD